MSVLKSTLKKKNTPFCGRKLAENFVFVNDAEKKGKLYLPHFQLQLGGYL